MLGCGSDGGESDGEGTVEVSVYGESFIEEGIAASEVDDGWSVLFERFDVVIRDIEVAGARIENPAVTDLTQPSSGAGHPLGSAAVPAGGHTGASFIVARVEVVGRAMKNGETKTFAWTFDQPTRYEDCETTTSVANGERAEFEITVHADHLLYDSLVAEEPRLLFQPLADADQDQDGAITQAELADADIGAYDPGSDGDVNDLWSWLVAQSRTLGHVDGEGHCHAREASE